MFIKIVAHIIVSKYCILLYMRKYMYDLVSFADRQLSLRLGRQINTSSSQITFAVNKLCNTLLFYKL